jgi:hypothetical protein
MTTTRRLFRASWVTVTAMLFLLAGGTAAWAKPAPIDTGDAAAPGGPAAVTSGTSVSQLLLVAALSAALAVVVTLVVARVVGSRRHGAGLPATA